MYASYEIHILLRICSLRITDRIESGLLNRSPNISLRRQLLQWAWKGTVPVSEEVRPRAEPMVKVAI
jgi:hypothetical protein